MLKGGNQRGQEGQHDWRGLLMGTMGEVKCKRGGRQRACSARLTAWNTEIFNLNEMEPRDDSEQGGVCP